MSTILQTGMIVCGIALLLIAVGILASARRLLSRYSQDLGRLLQDPVFKRKDAPLPHPTDIPRPSASEVLFLGTLTHLFLLILVWAIAALVAAVNPDMISLTSVLTFLFATTAIVLVVALISVPFVFGRVAFRHWIYRIYWRRHSGQSEARDADWEREDS